MKTAKKFSSNYKGCKPFNKEKLFFKNKDIDAVYIATPNTLHAKQSIESLQHRIPVLCEKPISMNLQEIHNMVSASEKNNTALLEAMWMRYLPHIDFLKKILKDDPIGKVHSLYACHGQNLKGVKNPRLWTKELGVVLSRFGNICSFIISNDIWNPKNIQAKSIFTKEGIDAKTSMIFEYNNGEIANLNCTMYDSHPNRAVISGEEGWIEIDPTFYAQLQSIMIKKSKKNNI